MTRSKSTKLGSDEFSSVTVGAISKCLVKTKVVATATQPAPRPTFPAPQSTPSLHPAANDPIFNIKKGIRLMRVLGGVAGVILGVFIPDNASLEEEWEIDGVNYKYNTDDFSLEITNPDGSKEQVKMYPDGTVIDQQGAIMGSVKDGEFTPATEQEDVDFRVWKANGGKGSFAVWKNSGKPLDVDGSVKTESGGTLIFHENLDGHTIRKHVGKTDGELLKRFDSEPDLLASSTFPDLQTAEQAVGDVLLSNQSKVQDWLNDPNPKKPLTLNKTLEYDIGNVIQNGKTSSETSNKVFVLLRKDPLAPNGYRVHTAYPKPNN